MENQTIEAKRAIISTLADEAGETLKSLSLKLGKNPAYLQQYINLNKPQKLDGDLRIALARLLGIDEILLKDNDAAERYIRQESDAISAIKRRINQENYQQKRLLEDQRRPNSQAFRPDFNLSETFPIEKLSRDLQVYGIAWGATDGMTIDLSAPSELQDRPPMLVGVKNAFGVRMTSETMFPRYNKGEVLHVHPGWPFRRGDYVVIELAGKRGIVKRYIGKEGDEVEVEQLNPQLTERIPNADIVAIFRIVGSAEA